MEVVFLGTSSMVPTKERGQTGILVDCGKEKALVDCGENMQRQLRIAGIAPPRITRLFLTHWHGDHILGLPGFFENIGKNSFEKKIEVYGTLEVKKKVAQIMRTFELKTKVDIKFHVIEKNGVFLDTGDYKFGAVFLKHSIPCLGYYIVRKDKLCIDKEKMKKLGLPSGPIIADLKNKKNVNYKGLKVNWKDVTFVKEGKKVGVVLDTANCAGAVKVGKNADLLICESTFLGEMEDRAKKYKHLTCVGAAEIAKKAEAKKLVLTHFSQRYEDKDVEKMKNEAKEVFKGEIVAAKDFMKIKV